MKTRDQAQCTELRDQAQCTELRDQAIQQGVLPGPYYPGYTPPWLYHPGYTPRSSLQGPYVTAADAVLSSERDGALGSREEKSCRNWAELTIINVRTVRFMRQARACSCVKPTNKCIKIG